LVANNARDRLKRQRLNAAYQAAAASTIEYCENEGYSARSDIWNAVTTLLGTETRAQQIASWYSRTTIDPTEFQEMIGHDPTVGQFLEYFISLLNQHQLDLLPSDLRVVTDIISIQLTQISRQIDEARHEIVEISQREPLTPLVSRPSLIG
jgi:hypothetical protein